MLQAAHWGDALRGHGPGPLQGRQIENEQVVEPVLAITASKDEHHVFNDTGRVELAHRRLASDDRRNVE